jgi:hypothetical protein
VNVEFSFLRREIIRLEARGFEVVLERPRARCSERRRERRVLFPATGDRPFGAAGEPTGTRTHLILRPESKEVAVGKVPDIYAAREGLDGAI